MEIRMLPAPEDGQRVESGPVQFGTDWPGTFIRGDHAAYYTMSIQRILEKHGDSLDFFMERVPLQNLMQELASSRV